MNALDKLWELQSVLTELAGRESLLTDKPESFAAVDERYQAAKAETARLEEKLEACSHARRSMEIDLQVEQENLKKYEGQLMQVKNQQQYSAAWKEIETAKKKVKEFETAVLGKMTEQEDAQKALQELLDGHAGLTAEWEAAHSAWQDSLAHVRAEIETIKAKAAALEAKVPPGPLRQFKRIFEQRQGIAVARIEGGACGACRFRVRSQAILQIGRGEFITCEGCARILYPEKLQSGS